ncbi:MAG: hypothetical protein H0V63_02620 [Burkholderiaceae bacterium]|nr:hypothetical protein [Burkholderiaceae bacterium]
MTRTRERRSDRNGGKGETSTMQQKNVNYTLLALEAVDPTLAQVVR